MSRRKAPPSDVLAGFLIPADAIVPCGLCGAAEGIPCTTMPKDKKPLEPGFVHFGRRVKRLLLTATRSYEEREQIEAEAVEMLREHLSTQSTDK